VAPRILIAVDGSEVSRRALDRVAGFLKEGAEVALVTVARPIYRDPPYTGYADPKDEEEQRQVLYAARDALGRERIAATGLAPVGDPADEILKAVKHYEAELIRGTLARHRGAARPRLRQHEGHARGRLRRPDSEMSVDVRLDELTTHDNAERRRYEVRIGAKVVGVIAYHPEPEQLTLSHTEVDPAFEGEGVASRLVAGALEDIRRRGLALVLIWPFVRAYLERHPEQADLVAAR